MIFCCACGRNCITTPTGRRMCSGKICSRPWRTNLGYGDRSPSQRIEKFMRDLYVHMRNIYLITRTLEQRMALLSPQQTEPARQVAPAAARRRAAQNARAGGRLFVRGRRDPRGEQPDFPRFAAPADARVSARAATAFDAASRPGAAHPQPAFAREPRVSERRACARNFSDHPRTARRGGARPARDARGQFSRQIHSRIRQADLPRAA